MNKRAKTICLQVITRWDSHTQCQQHYRTNHLIRMNWKGWWKIMRKNGKSWLEFLGPGSEDFEGRQDKHITKRNSGVMEKTKTRDKLFFLYSSRFEVHHQVCLKSTYNVCWNSGLVKSSVKFFFTLKSVFSQNSFFWGLVQGLRVSGVINLLTL